MSSESALDIQALNKVYAIYSRPEDRLKQMLLRKWRKYYREFWALKDINLKVNRGETVGIVGKNGSGKSTLLQIISGTVEPTSGTINVSGRVAALLELGAGFNPEFTGRENVYLAAAILGLTSAQIDERYDTIAEFAGIGDFIDQPVKLYSSGMYARLAFSVAAHVDADILIIDEILSVGDAAFTQKCMRFIHNFRKKGTLLFVSHDTASVVNLCDRAVWLDSGMVREIGPAKDVCHNYLAAVNEERDNGNTFKIGGSRKNLPPAPPAARDHRAELLKSSQHRNDVEIFAFDPNAPWFGHRGANIQHVTLSRVDAKDSTILEGGEEVLLEVTCQAAKDITSPIVGFYVKDRLGQNLFGDNTYITYKDCPLIVMNGQSFSACFRFQLPYLPTGDYSVLVAIAEGTQMDHIQHHWVDDAMFFRVHSSHVARGLMGLPMLDIHLGPCEAGDQSTLQSGAG